MTTETLHFQYDPIQLARQLLIIYFESELKAFDTSLLSHGNYEIKYETPVFIRSAVYDTLETISDDQLENFMTQVVEDYGIKDEFTFDQYLPQIFKKIIESDYFSGILKKNYKKHPVFDSYVEDKTNGNIYRANFTGHYGVVVAVLSQHPELDSTEKQDDFVMNHLKLVGESYNQAWYKPKHFVRYNDDDTKLYQYDYRATFNQVYYDALSANNTEKPEPNWHIIIDDYENDELIDEIINDKQEILQYLILYNLLEEAPELVPEFFTDDLDPILNFVQNSNELFNIKSTNTELIELKTTHDTILDREELIIYKD